MTDSHRDRCKVLYDTICDLAPEEQRARLAAEPDAAVRAEVESLLAFDSSTGFLAPERDTPPIDPVDRVAPPSDENGSSIPSRISDYRILGEVGSGGMGRVYLAEQDEPRRRVAIKVMHAGVVSPALLRRFAREAELLGRLVHPGIAQIYAASTDSVGTPYLAMEFVDGISPLEFADAERLDPRGRLELVARICDAVAHAHEKGVIHRDLKLGNILVTSSGQPKVLDFGIAATIDDGGRTEQHTLAGQLVGTIDAMSPEQAAGRRDEVDTRSDVYALGVIAFELLTNGEHPHETDELSVPEALRRIAERPPRGVEQVAQHVDADAATVVNTALAHDRTRRYATAAAFADDIRRYLRHEPIHARPTTAVYQLRLFARRNRALVAAGALAIVALVGGTALSLWQAARAEAARADEARAREDAEARVKQLRSFVSELAFDIYDEVQDLPGAATAREQLLVLALDTLEQLRVDVGDDPGLLRELADTYVRLGRLASAGIDATRDEAGLGRAEQCFTSAIELCDQAVAQSTRTASDRGSIAKAQIGLGELDYQRGAMDEARAWCERAIATLTTDDSEQPTAAWLGTYARALRVAGKCQLVSGQLDDALVTLATAEEQARAGATTAQADRDRTGADVELRQILALIAQASARTGAVDRAEESALASRDVAARLCAEDADNKTFQDAHAASLSMLAWIAYLQRDQERRLGFQLEAVAIRRALAEDNPRDGITQVSYVGEINATARVLRILDRLDEAEAELERGRAIVARWQPALADVARAMFVFAEYHYLHGDIQRRRDRPHDAIESIRGARDLIAAVCADGGTLLDLRRLTEYTARIAELHLQVGALDAAADEATTYARRADEIVAQSRGAPDDACRVARAAMLGAEIAQARAAAAADTASIDRTRWAADASRGFAETLRQIETLLERSDLAPAQRADLEWRRGTCQERLETLAGSSGGPAPSAG